MKQYSQNFSLKKLSIGKLLLIALAIRLVLIPLSYHSDLNNNEIWGIYANEFGLRGFYDWLNFGNYARPDYPPLAMVLFLALRWVWQILFDLLWFINIKIPLFPSGIMSWFDEYGFRALIKLPGVFADIGIGYVIYNFFKEKKEKAKYLASLFLFNPAVIYLSGSWGQLDSVVSFFALLAVLSVKDKKYYVALFDMFTSVMVKATYSPLVLILLIKSFMNKISITKFIKLSILLTILLTALGSLFIDANPLNWIVNLYLNKIIKGAVTLPYINLNAFNFWGLILGLERIKDDGMILASITLSQAAYAVSGVLLLLILRRFIKGADMFFTIVMFYFAIFMFFPRVHERYLYSIFIFLPFVITRLPSLKKYFYILSVIFMINLYHWWWFPRIDFLVYLFDLELVERSLSFANLVIFIVLWKKFHEEES